MIQFKAKNKYWTVGDRWYKLPLMPKNVEYLNFDDYNYIIGDKIFTELSDEAIAAFDTVQMWQSLQG